MLGWAACADGAGASLAYCPTSQRLLGDGDFDRVFPSVGGTGSLVYQICRSVDSSSAGFNGAT
jgi:hypothetical protein